MNGEKINIYLLGNMNKNILSSLSWGNKAMAFRATKAFHCSMDQRISHCTVASIENNDNSNTFIYVLIKNE